ncbi:MAG: xanthine dehydrogenase family protein subunit M [Burkholderiaceae bacterium]|jgi:carbon-monoxide dehydrogenase medium subunit|nr:xanthine dehydrogenase family protein subunit M [Burkholderiaceae bacterium]
MKAPAFDYVKPKSLNEALGYLKQYGSGAQVLAGGQSLMAIMNLGLAMPEVLIDITGLPGLTDITVTDEGVRVGALVTHATLQHSPVIAKHVPLLWQCVPHVAHLAIRNAGTLGGSIALADPAAEYPAVVLALQATITLQGPHGVRDVAADDYFLGLYETARAEDELLVAVTFPKVKDSEVMVFDELTRRRGDYALCGLAAAFDVSGGVIRVARLAYLSMGDTPVLAPTAAAALMGKAPSEETIAAAEIALINDLSPRSDLHGSVNGKLHWAKVLFGRSVRQLGKSA